MVWCSWTCLITISKGRFLWRLGPWHHWSLLISPSIDFLVLFLKVWQIYHFWAIWICHTTISGKIPSGTKIHGFSPFSFIANPELCGAPLTNGCGEDAKGPIPDNDDEEDNGWTDMKWFYLGMPWGFVVGFWAILAPLVFNRAWRYAYFLFLDDIKYKLVGWYEIQIIGMVVR